MWVLVLVGAILVVAGVGFVLLRRKRRRTQPAGTQPQKEPWTRGEIIGILGLIIGVPSVVVSVVALLPNDGNGSAANSRDKTVPLVYNEPERRALDILGDNGFTNIRTIVVCSDSVPEGHVREVLLDKDSDLEDEIVVVNEAGANPEIKVPPTKTRLLVKVSSGKVC